MILNPEKLRKRISFYRLAKILKTSPSTVYSWKNKVPDWRVWAIETYCQEQGINISDCYEPEESDGSKDKGM